MIRRIQILIFTVYNIFLLKLKGVVFGSNLRIRGPFNLDIRKNSELLIGDNFSVASGLMINPLGRNLKSTIRLDENAHIIIGNNVGMSNVCLWSKKKIIIGNNVKLGSGVVIIDSDMHSLDFIQRRNYKTDATNAKKNKVIIEDDVFIGLNSIITKGVKIGRQSIIAAGSVVIKSIPSCEIWGGNPARFIKKI